MANVCVFCALHLKKKIDQGTPPRCQVANQQSDAAKPIRLRVGQWIVCFDVILEVTSRVLGRLEDSLASQTPGGFSCNCSCACLGSTGTSLFQFLELFQSSVRPGWICLVTARRSGRALQMQPAAAFTAFTWTRGDPTTSPGTRLRVWVWVVCAQKRRKPHGGS